MGANKAWTLKREDEPLVWRLAEALFLAGKAESLKDAFFKALREVAEARHAMHHDRPRSIKEKSGQDWLEIEW